MLDTFCIPLRHQEGKYPVSELNNTDKDALTMTFKNNRLKFQVPNYKRKAEIFAVPKELETLTATV